MFYRHDDIHVPLDANALDNEALLENVVAHLTAQGRVCSIVSRGKVPMVEVDGDNYWVELPRRYEAGQQQEAILKLD